MHMGNIQRLKSILMANDGTRNNKVKMISCKCTADYKFNCCGCKKKQYHVHYIVKKHVEGDGIIMLYEYPRIIQRR